MTKSDLSLTSGLVVCLLAEELKSRHFFNTLRTLGLGDSFYQTDLCDVILELMNRNDHTGETLDTYHYVVEKYSARLQPSRESALHHGLMAYWELLRKLKGN